MSVNNPSDSGGGTDVAFANPPSMTEMDMGTMGAWAEIMAEEQMPAAATSEKNDENEAREQSVKEGEEEARKSEQQNFAVQVTNLPACTIEELYYHFGGDNVVRDVAFLTERRYAARLDLHTADGLKSAKELDGQQFRGRTLRVYELREEKVRERPSPQEYQSRQFSNDQAPYNRDNSRYNSQSSLYSNDARNFERNSRPYTSSNDYRGSTHFRGPPMSGGGGGGTFPRGYKNYNNYDEYNSMGRYPSGGQPYRGNGPYYQNTSYGGGEEGMRQGHEECKIEVATAVEGITMEARSCREVIATTTTRGIRRRQYPVPERSLPPLIRTDEEWSYHGRRRV